MSFTLTTLAWGLLTNYEAYSAGGNLDAMLDCINWPLEYFIKAHQWGGYHLFGQVSFCVYFAILITCIAVSEKGLGRDINLWPGWLLQMTCSKYFRLPWHYQTKQSDKDGCYFKSRKAVYNFKIFCFTKMIEKCFLCLIILFIKC